jgi:succinate-semialdehyde dehydrogenase / glutarate-semialdehyde dehydrogenase
MLVSYNPFTNDQIGEFNYTDLDELDHKLSYAQLGFKTWKSNSAEQRSELLLNLASILRKNQEECAHLISQEMGKVIRESRQEVEKSAMVIEYYAKNGLNYLEEQKKQAGDSEGLIIHEPMGAILGIMPWNYPFWQFFRFAASTLMAGNVILLKHSSQVPACSLKIQEIFERACCPDGVFQNLVIPASYINNIIKDYRVQGVSFTGSVGSGQLVAQQAGKHIKKIVLELGGSDPFIVLEDADIQKAAKAAAASRMKNFGQSCDAAKRFIIHESVSEQFLDLFREELKSFRFGDPLEDDSDYCCLSGKLQKQLLSGQLKKTLDMGASILWQGSQKTTEDDAFFNPIIINEVNSESPAYKQELFGPVAPVFVVPDAVEAIRIANDTEFGLGASIWTSELDRAWKLASEIQAGVISINEEVSSKPQLPFGGTKKSGIGREMSAEGIKEFTNIKSLSYSV